MQRTTKTNSLPVAVRIVSEPDATRAELLRASISAFSLHSRVSAQWRPKVRPCHSGVGIQSRRCRRCTWNDEAVTSIAQGDSLLGMRARGEDEIAQISYRLLSYHDCGERS